jgi:hypothetical protein
LTIDFSDILNILEDDPFEEYPVDVRTFVADPKFLGQPELSDHQYTLVECMSQIYKLDDLKRFMSSEDAANHYNKYTKNEIIQQLGKGSGKDHTSTIGTAYTVYKLMCLKDPARYYGKPPGDSIDIINIAINAQQAKNVFFDNFIKKIRQCPWFAGKYEDKVLSSTNLLLFIRGTQKEKAMRVLTCSWLFLTRFLDLQLTLLLATIRPRLVTISIKHSVAQ